MDFGNSIGMDAAAGIKQPTRSNGPPDMSHVHEQETASTETASDRSTRTLVLEAIVNFVGFVVELADDLPFGSTRSSHAVRDVGLPDDVQYRLHGYVIREGWNVVGRTASP